MSSEPLGIPDEKTLAEWESAANTRALYNVHVDGHYARDLDSEQLQAAAPVLVAAVRAQRDEIERLNLRITELASMLDAAQDSALRLLQANSDLEREHATTQHVMETREANALMMERADQAADRREHFAELIAERDALAAEVERLTAITNDVTTESLLSEARDEITDLEVENDRLAAVITRVREQATAWTLLDRRWWGCYVEAGRKLLALLPTQDSGEETGQ